jgi:Fe-S-cluster containining protein
MNPMECKRCGTCCNKGGPSFHIEDKYIIEEGYIPAKHLYTIRKGEPVRDNITEKIVYTSSDIIKIKGQKNGWACFYYDEIEKSCSVYKYRPLECRILNCRDTGEIKKIIGRNLLARKDIINNVGGLWEIVIEHDQRCSFRKIKKLIEQQSQTENAILSGKVAELVEYDRIMRELIVKKGQLNPELLDFLFGRPLSIVINNFLSHQGRSGSHE